MTTAPGTLRTFTVNLSLPPAELSPNGSHGHWSAKAEARGTYRAACYTDALGAWFQAFGTRARPIRYARLSLRFVWCTGRRTCDLDNAVAMFKPGQDGLVDAGVIQSDSWIYLSYGSISAARCKRGCHCGGRVEATVEEVSE